MARHEYSEWLWIEDGILGDAQASSFGNGTLQTVADANLAFTVHTHVGIPAGVTDENTLRHYLANVFGRITALGLEVAFEIQIGPDEEQDEDDAEERAEMLDALADNEDDEAEYHRLRAEAARLREGGA